MPHARLARRRWRLIYGWFGYSSGYISRNIDAGLCGAASMYYMYFFGGILLCQTHERSDDEPGRHIPATRRLQPRPPEPASPAAAAFPAATVSSTACSPIWRSLQRPPTAAAYCLPPEHVPRVARAPPRVSPSPAHVADRPSSSPVLASDAVTVPLQRLPGVCARPSTIYDGLTAQFSSAYACISTPAHSFRREPVTSSAPATACPVILVSKRH